MLPSGGVGGVEQISNFCWETEKWGSAGEKGTGGGEKMKEGNDQVKTLPDIFAF